MPLIATLTAPFSRTGTEGSTRSSHCHTCRDGNTSKPAAALVAALRNLPDFEDQLHTGFPILLVRSDWQPSGLTTSQHQLVRRSWRASSLRFVILRARRRFVGLDHNPPDRSFCLREGVAGL